MFSIFTNGLVSWNFFQIIFLILAITPFSENSCLYQVSIDEPGCFNALLKFSHKKYRAGHFVTYKNGDMIAEFSDDGGPSSNSEGYSRIFYGLKANGRYYFPGEIPTFEIETIIDKSNDIRGRYESLNHLVVTETDSERNNEYLFSTSSYNSLFCNVKNARIFAF